MSTWVSNGPCPSCGSKDNLATYDDGHQWCWGCGYHVGGDRMYAVRSLLQPVQDVKPNVVVLPYDVDTNYPQEAINWVQQYDITRSDLLKNRVLWSESSGLLIFTFSDGEGRPVAWQGRNFGKKYRTKWFGRGILEDTFVFFPGNPSRIEGIIFVEDIVSAIKLGKVIDEHGLSWRAMPIFGSHISRKRMSRCLLLMQNPCKMMFWLDRDKASEAIKFQRVAQSLGIDAYVTITEQDPKELSNDHLYYYLK